MILKIAPEATTKVHRTLLDYSVDTTTCVCQGDMNSGTRRALKKSVMGGCVLILFGKKPWLYPKQTYFQTWSGGGGGAGGEKTEKMIRGNLQWNS